MGFDPISRRHFLKGAGATLFLPLLPSILPRVFAQSASPQLRYIQCISSFGQYSNMYYPTEKNLIQQAGGAYSMPLSSISGDISSVLGSAFSPFKNKMSLLRGMHVSTAGILHNVCLPTAASGSEYDSESDTPPRSGYSMDGIIAASNKIYPNDAGKQRLVNIAPAPDRPDDVSLYGNYSWTKKNGKTEIIAGTFETKALLSKFAIPAGGGSTTSPDSQRNADVIQGVFEDYKQLRDGGKLASEDKIRLESYMDLIDQVQRGLASTSNPGLACSPATQESESSDAAKHRNQARILAAAIACGQTNVISYILSAPYSIMHDYSHNDDQFTQHAAEQKKLGNYIAYLMDLLDKMPDAYGGTVLDNSIVYWGNEFGENPGGDPHRADNMTAMVAGGAAGRLQMGQYITYAKSGCRPFNNFLITLANAMGLTSSDYERDGIAGFGEYHLDMVKYNKFESYNTTDERRKALPYFYKGTIAG